MRSWVIAALGVLAIGLVAPSAANATPAGGQTAVDRATTESPLLQDVRYVTRCHHVRVWRNHHRVWVRRCHRVWVQ